MRRKRTAKTMSAGRSFAYIFDRLVFDYFWGEWYPEALSGLTGITTATGKTWCITGKFKKKYKRDNIHRVITDMGGYIDDKVMVGSTSVLVATDAVPWETTKLVNARKWGITIMSEDEFENNILRKHPDYGKGKW